MSERPTQTQHVEALVLAFSYSRARSLVGTDALRTVIGGQYRDMVRDDEFDLESLWTLLEGQPGFDAAAVKPPLCRFKTWEGDLELAVKLPPQLGELSSLEVRAFADECTVPQKELDRILERGAFSEVQRAKRAAKWQDEKISEPITPAVETSSRKTFALALLCVIALGGLIASGYFIYDGFLRGAPTSKVSPARFTGIPVKKAVRTGIDVRVELTDESWLARPQTELEAALRNSMTELSLDGVRGLFIVDNSGKVRATAQTYGPEQRRVRVKFR